MKKSNSKKPSYLNFDHDNYFWKSNIDYTKNPHLYKVGKGEQGVLLCQPYKKEIGKFWRFKTPELSIESSNRIYQMFENYLSKNEFVGADMARKYLQMGFTRARRYANYKGGRKYDKNMGYKQLKRGTGEEIKAVCADIFFEKWQLAESNQLYKYNKIIWRKNIG
jgi:hypothetical protein